MGIKEVIISSLKLFCNNEQSYEEIKERVTIKNVLFVYVALSLIINIIVNIITFYNSQSIHSKFYLVFVNTILLTFMVVLGLFLGYSLLYLLLYLFKGKADYIQTLKLYFSLSIFPQIVSGILNIIVTFVYRDVLIENITLSAKNIIIIGGYFVIILLLMIWYIIISIKLFSKLHELSLLETTIAIFVIPMIIVVLLLISLVFLLRLFFIP